MKQILWFRRDLRVEDSALLAHARGEVLPVFIFDTNILDKLCKDDKRVSFIYNSVLQLKKKLQDIGLDLVIFYGEPFEVFNELKTLGFNEVLCSIDFDSYAIKRDKQVEKLLHVRRFIDSYLLNPNEHLKADGNPYKVFTPFYKSLAPLWQSQSIAEYKIAQNIQLFKYNYSHIPSLSSLGFEAQKLPNFLFQEPKEILKAFSKKLQDYPTKRDYFTENGTSNLGVFLRFGLLSPKQVFNYIKSLHVTNGDEFIRELFWREFYAYLLYHFPHSETQNFRDIHPKWRNNKEEFQAWCEGKTGVPIIDACMQYFNQTGLMHNRLRMIVSSFLTKNLLIDWRWGEEYFAKHLLDYDAASNIGSWQWAASTGADSVPYFRVFNPYTQSKKFDKDGIFIKSVLKEYKNTEPKLLHVENPNAIVDIKTSRLRAIEAFK